jgi:hypothetical protein
MKTTVTLCLLAIVVQSHGQLQIDNIFYINSGAIFYTGQPIDVNTNGLFQVNGEAVISAEINGDERLQMEASGSLYLNNGTLTLGNEVDEEFSNLTLGVAGFLEIPAGKSLTLNGDLNNLNTNQGLKLFADATGYAQLLTNGSISNKGSTYIEQLFTTATNPGWRQVCSPVSITLAQVEDDFTVNYSGAPIAEQNVFWWDAQPITPGSNAQAVGWTAALNNTEVFGPAFNGRAFNLFTSGNIPALNGGKLDVVGEIGNGFYFFGIYATQAEPAYTSESTGWNLIPNPYPSNIDVASVLTAQNFTLSYRAIHAWDAKNQQYLAISDDVSININYNLGGSLPLNNNIAPFQAFWIKGDDTPSSSASPGQLFFIDNNYRTVSATSNFFKTAPPLIRLNVIASGKIADQTILTFEDLATDNLEPRDAFKLGSLNPDKPSIYSGVQGKAISINRLAIPAPDKHIPLCVDANSASELSIEMIEATVSQGWVIELEDHKTGAIHNLRDDKYTYINDPGFTGVRFTVHINKNGESITSTNASRINIFGDDNGINVVFGFYVSTTSANILISNLAGQIFYSGTVATDQPFVFPVTGPVSMYVVHVTTGDLVEADKIVR